MNDKPDGPRLNKMARLNQWSKAFPNARLAVLGVLLIYTAGGVLSAIEAAGRPAFEYLNQWPDGRLYWDAMLKCIPFVAVLLGIPMIAGMTMIAFAAYRVIRDRFAKR
jgi:hypothetical protein